MLQIPLLILFNAFHVSIARIVLYGLCVQILNNLNQNTLFVPRMLDLCLYLVICTSGQAFLVLYLLIISTWMGSVIIFRVSPNFKMLLLMAHFCSYYFFILKGLLWWLYTWSSWLCTSLLHPLVAADHHWRVLFQFYTTILHCMSYVWLFMFTELVRKELWVTQCSQL